MFSMVSFPHDQYLQLHLLSFDHLAINHHQIQLGDAVAIEGGDIQFFMIVKELFEDLNVRFILCSEVCRQEGHSVA
jgi:hypothetical protein